MRDTFYDSIFPLAAIAGLAAAGLAGVAAAGPLLIGSDILFYKLVTSHLGFAIHLWIPLAEIAIWLKASRKIGASISGKTYAAITFLSITGGLLIVAGATVGASKPYPLDYSPLFDTPLFYCGMALIYSGWLLSATIFIIAWSKRGRHGKRTDAASYGYAAATIAAWVSAINLVAAYITLPDGLSFPYAPLTLVYGAGHTIQFAHVLTMVAIWAELSNFSKKDIFQRGLKFILAAAAGAALWTPLYYLTTDPVSQTHEMTWTLLLGMGLGSAATLAGVVILISSRLKGAGILLLLISFASFLFGGWAPGLSDRTALSLTAHYHGLLGAVSTAYLARLFGRAPYRPTILFGAGTLLVGAAFARLAPNSIPRKTAPLDSLMMADPIAAAILIVGAITAATALALIYYEVAETINLNK